MKAPHPITERRDPGRREFLQSLALLPLALAGCATNPVTGERELMFLSEADELQIDRTQSPHQFSEDYGVVRDAPLNNYIGGVGAGIVGVSHRPGMPYTFRAVHASHANAYAFPGGSIAATRGILHKMESEAELAALMGHEVGHVCARHSAKRMTSGILANLVVAGAALAASQSEKYGKYAGLISGVGSVGAGLLLARYSRADERQADALGMEYMVKAGHPPVGMVRLMNILRGMEREQPGVIELMFATHPMSAERYDTAILTAQEQYAEAAALPDGRERYMDHTAGIRRSAPVIQAIQNGDAAAVRRDLKSAESNYALAVKADGRDYEALLKMARCLMAQGRSTEARGFAVKAQQVYPEEAGAVRSIGEAALQLNRFDEAAACFTTYEERLPGNPGIRFLRGMAFDQMGRKQQAAEDYAAYLDAAGTEGDPSRHALQRLKDWGFIKEE